jgi:hypothetical protein
MATELMQPGVEVIQEFRTVSPTIVTPTLVPCAVAPAFQILEAQEQDATGNTVVNSDAVVTAPAVVTAANPGDYQNLDEEVLIVSVNGGAEQEITFSDPTDAGLSAAQLVDQISAAAPTGFGAFVSTSGGSDYLQLRSTGKGTGQTLKILPSDANAILGFNDNFVVEGTSLYRQESLQIEQDNFPDPRGIIAEVDVDESSIRAFINTGSVLREIKRTETFLRNKRQCIYTSGSITFPVTVTSLNFWYQEGRTGATQKFTFGNPAVYSQSQLVDAMNTLITGTTVGPVAALSTDKITFTSDEGYFEVIEPDTASAYSLIKWTVGDKAYTLEPVDDGDGDTKTPFIVADLDNFAAPPTAATLVGTVTLTAPVDVHNKTFEAAVDGGHMQSVLFDGGPIVSGAVFNAANTLSGTKLYFSVNGVAKLVTFSGANPIGIASAVTQINTAAGVAVCYRSDISGGEDPLAGTYISYQVGGATATPGGVIALTFAGSDGWTDLGLTGAVDLTQELTLAQIENQLNATFGAGFADIPGTNKLNLFSLSSGYESKLEIFQGTANTDLGFTEGDIDYGTPFAPKVGDAVYADGTLIGYIALVSPGGYTNRLKLDREVATDFGGASMYIQALSIPSSLPADRPTPDLVIDTSGAVLIKHDIMRDTEGNPFAMSGSLLLAYKALRLDVTALAEAPGLLTLDDTTVLDDTLAPVNADNPLALMLYFMLINAPGISVTGIGVDATSALNPDGTPEAYQRALNFLEAQEVYALAPASQDPTVHQLFATHVTSMSEPDAKGERIVFINPKMPDEAVPDMVTSGTDGDSTAVTNDFDTKSPTLPSDFLAAGVDPVGTIPVSSGAYLTIATNAYKYNISAVTGSTISIRVAFAPGENDDGFYATTNLPSTLISETFSIWVRGEALVDPNDLPDYNAIAQAYQDLGKTYANRRLIMVAPEYVGANIDSSEQKIKGYYACAAIAGMVGQLAPQQPFTNYPITGFTRVYGSNDVFTTRQMNIGAAGGTYWVVQEVAGGSLSTRHQLTTDLTSIEKRELSITKVVDFVAKFMRAGLRSFIGKFNITQSFLDTLSTVVQGQLGFLVEAGVLIGGDLNNIVQDESAPDTVLIDVTLDVPYPCNYIRLTLVI